VSPAWKDRYQPLDTVAETVHSRLIRGVDLVHDRPVALKIRTVHTPDQHASARREARTLLTLQPHPGLPTVRDDFVEGDDYVLVLDWVEGTDLARVLAARGSPGMPPAMVLAWVRDLADAAGHLHRHDPPIIHGDIKPANAILTPTGRVVLVDLGNATDSAVASLGTPGFAAPEVAFGGVATVGADIYGLAATTYALLAGRPPWLFRVRRSGRHRSGAGTRSEQPAGCFHNFAVKSRLLQPSRDLLVAVRVLAPRHSEIDLGTQPTPHSLRRRRN